MSDASPYILILAIGFVLIALSVLLAKRPVVLITSIGIGSVLLSIIFFLAGAPFAGAIELSVGAGLISVLFIIATGLTDKNEEGSDPP